MLRETHCPLCSGNDTHAYHEDKHRQYLRCSRCCLVFVPTHWHLCHAAEKAQYDLHENSFGDAAYRAFLGRLAAPLFERVAPPASGLDFGCGPVAVLAAMLREAGYTVDTFDAYYARNADVFARRYDFICASEVVEHLSQPARELARLWGMLRHKGYLAVMTKLVLNREAFAQWHYIRDPTHVCFFSRQTWSWWARQQGAACEFISDDVILLQRLMT